MRRARPGTGVACQTISTATRLPSADAHPHARAVLTAGLPPHGAPNHAYLFHGPAGAGKRETARAFAAALLSDGAPDPVAAVRRVVEGVHPDLTWVRPKGASEWLIADLREPVIAAVARTPFESARRVFVIERADLLGDDTANRMLKTLEEPPPFAHLILLTDRPGEVLPTITSRCQPVRFEAPLPEELADRLGRRGVGGETAVACARLALGDGDRATELALGDGPALRAAAEAFTRATFHGRTHERPWLVLVERAVARGETAAAEVERELTADIDLLPKKEQGRMKREAAETAKRAGRRARVDALDRALQLAGLWLRDVACVADGAPEHAHAVDRLEALARDAAALGPRGAHAARDGVVLVDDTRTALRMVNATEELALEALAYRLESTLR